MNDDIRKYLPDASAVRSVADERAAKERMRKALRPSTPPAAPAPALTRDATESKRKRLPRWLVAAGALAAVLLPTSLALLLSAGSPRAKEVSAAPDGTGAIGAMPRLPPGAAETALTAASAAPAPTVSVAPAPTVSASARGDPRRQGWPKKTTATPDAGAPSDQDPGLNE